MTIAPIPILISAYPCDCVTKAPEREIKAFPIIKPKILVTLVLTPRARTICSLFPVARIAEPISVPKYQYKIATITTETMIPMIKAVQVDDRPVISEMFLNSVSDFKSGVLERPIILKLIE